MIPCSFVGLSLTRAVGATLKVDGTEEAEQRIQESESGSQGHPDYDDWEPVADLGRRSSR